MSSASEIISKDKGVGGGSQEWSSSNEKPYIFEKPYRIDKTIPKITLKNLKCIKIYAWMNLFVFLDASESIL
jgi:hypothetical protein